VTVSSTTPPSSPKPGWRPRSRKEQGRLLALGFVVALAIVFAVVNLNDVSVNWIVTTSQTSLTVVIVVSFLFGVAIGALLHRRASR
jgi:uncharacterized integral membrane protein